MIHEKNYKFGIIKRIQYKNKKDNITQIRNIGICSCGQHIKGSLYQTHFDCDNCGNTVFINAIRQTRQRFVIPYFQILRKDSRGFKIKRINLSVMYDGYFVKPIKENLVRTLDYDIVDKRLIMYRNDVEEFNYEKDGLNNNKIDASQMFFAQLTTRDFIEVISSESTRDMYEVMKTLSFQGYKKDKVIIGLIKLFNEHSYIQILANAGIPKVDRFFETSKWRICVDNTKTKPHEILQIPKSILKFIREDESIDSFTLKEIQSSIKKIDGNIVKEIMGIAKDECGIKKMTNALERIMSLYDDYGYKNLRKLVLFLIREVKLFQGIDSPLTASTLLLDYIKMSSTMGLEYEKYPKSLKKEHDLVQMNYRVNEDLHKQEMFKLSVAKESYQKLVLNDKEYSVIIPETTDDLVKEGNQLSHCVASYVNDITNDKCKILFLRRTEELDRPLATIEIRGVNIRQARGFANRTIGANERKFIKDWAEINELVEAYY